MWAGQGSIPSRSTDLANRQGSAPHAVALNHDDAVRYLGLAQFRQDCAQSLLYLVLSPRAASKQNQSGPCRIRNREQAWIIKIGSHDDPPFVCCACDDLIIRCGMELQIGRVYRLMAICAESPRDRWRQWHVNEESHLAVAKDDSSMVSSSARKAA